MEGKEILAIVDHTLLRADASRKEIERLCDEAVKYKTRSVCIPQTYVKRVKEKYGEKLRICTVVGFPLGYNSTESKIVETQTALANGADEIDMVINICNLKNRDYDLVEEEIKALKKEVGEKILKVIVETCYLTEEEKIKVCDLVTEGGADFIKTSTGFGSKGADLSDIELFKKHLGEGVKIKASGGIRTREDLIAFKDAGCDRIGASSAVKVFAED